MAAADVQVAPGTPGSPGTWPGCGPPVSNRAASAFPLHRSAPATRLPSISSSPRHASMRTMSIAQLVARAAPRSATEMMVPPKATSQPALPAADQCAASHQAAAPQAQEVQQPLGTPAMPVCSTSTGTEAGTVTPAESHSEPTGWPALRSASLEADDLDSAINDLTRSAQLASVPDNYSLPEFPGQQAASIFAAANASAHVTAENSLEHIFDSMGLDDAPGLLRTGAHPLAEAEGGAFAHSQHGAPASAATAAAGPVTGSSHGAVDTQPYVLVRLDDKGNILRQATPDDIALMTQLISNEHPAPPSEAPTATERTNTSKVPRRTGGIQKRSGPSGGTRKPGGPCCHCGVKESPQWRRGPTMKPILCNACGTRYRRTHQLGPANNKSKASPAPRKGAAAGPASADTQP